MFTNPAITAALANEHRRDLITQADSYRLARAARNGNPARGGPFLAVGPASLAKRAVAATAAGFAAAAVLMASSAGALVVHHQQIAAQFRTARIGAAHFRFMHHFGRWA